MNKKAKHLQKIGININSFPSVLTSEWENHAPSMVSPLQAFPNITNIFLKTMDQIDFKHFDHDAEQQDMTALSIMVLPSMVKRIITNHSNYPIIHAIIIQGSDQGNPANIQKGVGDPIVLLDIKKE